MKSTTTITLDVEVLAAARKRNLKISSYCNTAIRAWLEMPESKIAEDRMDMEKEVNVLRAALSSAEKKLEEKTKKTLIIKG